MIRVDMIRVDMIRVDLCVCVCVCVCFKTFQAVIDQWTIIWEVNIKKSKADTLT